MLSRIRGFIFQCQAHQVAPKLIFWRLYIPARLLAIISFIFLMRVVGFNETIVSVYIFSNLAVNFWLWYVMWMNAANAESNYGPHLFRALVFIEIAGAFWVTW